MPVIINITAIIISIKKAFSVMPVKPSSIRSGTDIKLINSPKDFAGPSIINTAPDIIAVTFKQ